MIRLVPLEEKEESPELPLSLSPPCEDTERKVGMSASQGLDPHQGLNLLAL